MGNTNVKKRRNLRISPFVDDALTAVAKKNNISVNELISEIIMYHLNELDKVNNANNVTTILNELEDIKKDIDYLKKGYLWLNALTKQIFVNSGFRINRNISDDDVYQDFENRRYGRKYDIDFNA